MSQWEIYRKSGTKTRSKKYISITKSQTFGLPRPFIDGYNIQKGVKAVILYNRDSNEIALRFSNTKPEFGYSLLFGKNSKKHGAMIVAKKFFDDMDIDAKKYAGHYDNYRRVQMNELGFDNIQGEAFVIKLKERDNLISAAKQDEVSNTNI